MFPIFQSFSLAGSAMKLRLRFDHDNALKGRTFSIVGRKIFIGGDYWSKTVVRSPKLSLAVPNMGEPSGWLRSTF